MALFQFLHVLWVEVVVLELLQQVSMFVLLRLIVQLILQAV